VSDPPAAIARQQGRIGRITLNRPRTLNALDAGMIRSVFLALEAWRDNPAIHLVVIEAEGDRAFCAGGDVRTMRDWMLAGDFDPVEAFFVDEYALNRAIARYPKPYIALIDGLCMGGGMGLSMHGSLRVVSEHAKLAMPECQIGLFTDVGASFVLPRLRGAFGTYLGLTGRRVGPGDSCWLGLATHYVPRASLAGLADALAAGGLGALSERAETPPPGDLAAIAGPVDAVFGRTSLAAIVAGLETISDAWSQEALAAIATASPSALRWTFDALRAGADRTLEQCQRAELLLTRVATRHPDFAEGIRALVVDKDRQPRWAPIPVE